MKKTAIYATSGLQNTLRIETQIEFCKTQLKANDEYVTYSDNGYSTNDKERPAFNEMMSAIENDEIDVVIVYDISRICRDIRSFCEFSNTLYEHNVTLISAINGFNSSSDYGRALLQLLLVFCENERKNHSERCRRGWALRKQRKEDF